MRKMNGLLAFALLLITSTQLHAQGQPAPTATTPERPKLVVGIVVDQMRWDYLYRYSEKYGATGFKRLLKEGYSCENTHIPYMPTYTACGHSCVYTGSVPAINGIAGNAWYERDLKREINCVEDSTAKLVGTGTLKGNVSPKNLQVTTITDELRLATNYQSKVVALALKDRSAILPGGHQPTGAYFVDGGTGNFITTTYYTNALPAWVNAFNDKRTAEKYVSQPWNTLLPIEQYTESTPDDKDWERAFKGEKQPVFPHNVPELSKGNLDVIAATPFGNSLTLDFARAAVEGEKLGTGKFTDFLAISLSSTDIVSHSFGPNSIETEDTYLRLDKELGDFLSYLDTKIGKGSYVVFLTADHGAAHAAGFAKEHGIPAGSFAIDTTVKQLNAAIAAKYGDGNWILSHENMQLYLNLPLMVEKKVSREDLFSVAKPFLLGFDAIANVIDLQDIEASTLQGDIKTLLKNGTNVKRSGDFQLIYKPQWFEGFTKGTTHGTPYAYDTHIPLLWMGWKVKHAEDHSEVHMTDIAPTLAQMLHIQEPSGNVGKVILKLVDK